MTTSVLINVRLTQEMRSRFADFCAQQAKGELPSGFKNRFAMLPELTKDLPEKDYEGDEPWHVRTGTEWKTREGF